QVVHVQKQDHEHHEGREGDPLDGPVHSGQRSVTTWVIPSSWIGLGAGRRAASLRRASTATSSQLAIRLEPPWDRNGVVMPVNGISRVTPPTITKTCSANMKDSPLASSFE